MWRKYTKFISMNPKYYHQCITHGTSLFSFVTQVYGTEYIMADIFWDIFLFHYVQHNFNIICSDNWYPIHNAFDILIVT